MKATLNQIFSSNSVFAKNKPIRIFGKGTGYIEGYFQGEKAVAKTNEKGWILEFSPRDYGGPYSMEILLNGEKVTLSNVYVGEVILCAGQSNMHFKLSTSTERKEDYKANEKLRLFIVDRPESGERFFSADGWIECTKENAGEWPAIGYYVAQRIAQEKGCAVGIVACCQGASVIQSWLPTEALPTAYTKIPKEKLHPDHNYPFNGESFLYETMLSNIIPYSFSQAIWYQGESNSFFPEADTYEATLISLIERWREDFSDGELPFCVVQIADYQQYWFEKTAWKKIQSAQINVAKKTPFVKTVISRDVCETDDIHPPTKNKLAERIANAIL